MGNNICQSCGMLLKHENKGTNSDKSKHDEYCLFCYQNGEFTDTSLTLDRQTEKLIDIAVEKMKIPREKAREQANKILPNLKRWKIE